YVVINELASALYLRSKQERVDSPERRDYLMKAIAAYRRTLGIDSEDVEAHYGLAQAYKDPTWKSPRAAEGPSEKEGDSDVMGQLGRAMAEPKATADIRRDGARQLAEQVVAFMRGPRPKYESRLEPLHEIVERLGPAWERETDDAARGAM